MSASSNRFGHLFSWTSFGESHGPAMGVVIDGCPAGVEFDQALLISNLEKRRPGNNKFFSEETISERVEQDEPKILSGVFKGQTLGTPIAIVVENQGQRSEDYESIKANPRVGHADDLWSKKFGHYDHRGGGRASARETLNWVIAGSVAQMFCLSQNKNLKVRAQLKSVGSLSVSSLQDESLLELLKEAKEKGESYGGVVELYVSHVEAGLGEPVFKKMKSEMAHAFMTVNACNGVEFGDGFSLSSQKGSEVHKAHDCKAYGGLRGGMTSGEELKFRLAFKPTSSIQDVAKMGRHDPCVVLRALPVIEAMAWNVLADQILMKRLNRV